VSMKEIVTGTGLAILLLGAAQGMAGQNVSALKDVFRADFLIGGSLLLLDRNYKPEEAFFAVVKAAQPQ